MPEGINKVILVGELSAEPELRRLKRGDRLAELKLATVNSWVDKTTGEIHRRTEWHRVVCFGTAVDTADTLRCGDPVYVEGALRTRSWQPAQGPTRTVTEVIVGFTGVLQYLALHTASQAQAA